MSGKKDLFWFRFWRKNPSQWRNGRGNGTWLWWQKTEAVCSYLGRLGCRARKEGGQVIISPLSAPSHACLCFISAVVIKYFAKSNVWKKGFLLAQSSRLQYIIAGWSQCQELENEPHWIYSQHVEQRFDACIPSMVSLSFSSSESPFQGIMSSTVSKFFQLKQHNQHSSP